MENTIVIKMIRTLLTLCIFLVLLSGSSFAMSISPPRIFLDSVLKGTSTEQAILLGGIEHGSKVTVTLDGRGSEWVSLPLGKEFPFPDETEISLPFVLDVPEQAPNGDYKVTAQIISAPEQDDAGTDDNTAAISSGLFAEISFSVTGDEVIDYRISQVTIPKFEEGASLTVVIGIDNDGNVIARPSRVDIEVRDRDGDTVFTGSETEIQGVSAFSVGESIVTFDSGLEPEVYFADVSIHTHEGIFESSDISFDVLFPGTLMSSAELTGLTVQDDIGRIAKVTGFLENTGDIGFHASLNGEVYRDGMLVGTFGTDELYSEKKAMIEFVHFYTVGGDGEYVIRAHAEFLSKRTNEREVSFRIGPESQADSSAYMMLAIPALAIIVLIAYIKRRRNVSRLAMK